MKNPFKKISSFFGEIKAELKKVSWSTRRELIEATVVVLVGTTFLTIFIVSSDYLLNWMLQILIK